MLCCKQGSGEGQAAAGRLEASGKEVAEWLQSEVAAKLKAWRWCTPLSAISTGSSNSSGESSPDEVQAELAADDSLGSRVASAYLAIRHFEDTHHLDLQVVHASQTAMISSVVPDRRALVVHE